MVAPSPGAVVLVPFPFSDLSQSKLRPAIVLAAAGREDWILCQVTSNAYSDPLAIEIADSAFATGSLRRMSYARPGEVVHGQRTAEGFPGGNIEFCDAFDRVLDAVVNVLRP